MNVLICGTRNKGSREELVEAIEESGFDITTVGSGGAVGPDQLGIWWAEKVGKVKVKLFDPTHRAKGWGADHNPSPIIEWSEALICLWDGASTNTANTIEEARAHGRPVFIKDVV